MPLLTTVIVPVRVPVPPGVKATLNVQPAPALTVAQVELVTANSDGLLLLTLDTETAAPPVLVTVTLVAELVGADVLAAKGRRSRCMESLPGVAPDVPCAAHADGYASAAAAVDYDIAAAASGCRRLECHADAAGSVRQR